MFVPSLELPAPGCVFIERHIWNGPLRAHAFVIDNERMIDQPALLGPGQKDYRMHQEQTLRPVPGVSLFALSRPVLIESQDFCSSARLTHADVFAGNNLEPLPAKTSAWLSQFRGPKECAVF